MTVQLGPSPDWNLVTLQWAGTYNDGAPAAGSLNIRYVTDKPLLDDDAVRPINIFPVPIDVPIVPTTVTLNGQVREIGFAQIKVPASNDPDIQGSGGTYILTENLTRGTGRREVSFVADINAPGGIVLLNKLITADATPAQPIPVIYWSDFNDLVSRVETLETDTDPGPTLTAAEQRAALGNVPSGNVAGIKFILSDTDPGTLAEGEVWLSPTDRALVKPTEPVTVRRLVGLDPGNTQVAVDPATVITAGATRRTRNVWAAGDSITGGYLTYDNVLFPSLAAAGPMLQYQPTSWQMHALLASQCRWTFAGVHATPQWTAAQILATHVPNIIAAATPGDTVVVLAGTNGNVLADVKTIHTTLRAAGLNTVAVTIPPSTASTFASIAGFNEGLKRWAVANGIPVVDAYAALVDPATGNYLAAYNSGDGIHPSIAGQKVIGEAIAAVLNGQHATPVNLVAHNAAHTGQLKTNPLALAAFNVGTDYYNLSGLGTSTVTQGTVAGMTGGKSYRLTRGDTNFNTALGTMTLAAGARIRIGYALQFTPAGGGSFGMRWESATTGGKILFSLGYPTETLLAIPLSRFYVEFTVPTLPDYDYRGPRLSLSGAGSVLDVGEVTAYNLTTLGAV